MTQNTTDILINGTYDLTTIISDDIIEAPVKWIAHYNAEMSGFFVITFLILFGLLLYRMTKERGFSDPQAVMFAGFITTFVGLIAFLLSISADPANIGKIITWAQLMPFIVITMVAIVVDKTGAEF